jgi:hypothetical protein
MERKRMVTEQTGEMGKRTQDDEQHPKGVVRREHGSGRPNVEREVERWWKDRGWWWCRQKSWVNEHKSTWKRVRQVKRRERSWGMMERERMEMVQTEELGKRTQVDVNTSPAGQTSREKSKVMERQRMVMVQTVELGKRTQVDEQRPKGVVRREHGSGRSNVEREKLRGDGKVMERQRMVMEKTEELGKRTEVGQTSREVEGWWKERGWWWCRQKSWVNEHESTWTRVRQVKRRGRSWGMMERERMVMVQTGEMGKRTQDDEQHPKGVVRREHGSGRPNVEREVESWW